MSTCYWMCEGIGIPTSKLSPFLNKEKCIKFVKEQLPAEDVEDISEDEFEIEDYLYGEPFDNLAEIFTYFDDTNTLTYGDNGNGEYYFYYTPSYPWDRKDNEPTSIEEVHKRIIDSVLCLCDMTAEQVETLIDDDIYDVGCG